MIGITGLALMGRAPPAATGPPPQDVAEEADAFPGVIAAALMAMFPGAAGQPDVGAATLNVELFGFALAGGPAGATQQSDAGDSAPDGRLAGRAPDLGTRSGVSSPGRPVQEGLTGTGGPLRGDTGSQRETNVSRPDRIAEAGTTEALTAGLAAGLTAGLAGAIVTPPSLPTVDDVPTTVAAGPPSVLSAGASTAGLTAGLAGAIVTPPSLPMVDGAPTTVAAGTPSVLSAGVLTADSAAGLTASLTVGLTGAIVTPPLLPMVDGAPTTVAAGTPSVSSAGAPSAASGLPAVSLGTEPGQSVAPTVSQSAPLPATSVVWPARTGVSGEGAGPLEPDAPLIADDAPTADRRQRIGRTSAVAVPDGTLAAGVAPLLPAPPSEAVAPLAEPVDTADGPQLAARLADTVRWAVQTGESEFRMVLNPPEIGRLDVRVTETADGIRITLDAAMQEARELLQQHLPALRLALEARDLRVDRLEILQPEHADASELDDAPRGRNSGGTGNGDEGELPQWSPVAAMERERDPETQEAVPGSVERSSGTVDVRA